MDWQQEILDHNMNMSERNKADLADSILDAYNGSFKPHLKKIRIGNFGWSDCTFTKYRDGHGYMLVSNSDDRKPQCITSIYVSLEEYLEKAYKELFKCNISYSDIMNNPAVKHVMEKEKEI